MIIFDEKKYAQDILKDGYKTKKNQGIERCCLIRYLRSINKNQEDIIKVLDNIPFDKSKYLKREDVLSIYKKLLDKASNFEFIHGIEIAITEEDKKMILELDKKIQFVFYIYLVYYKWAKNIKRLTFKYNNKIYVEYQEKDLWKLCGLSSKKIQERYEIDGLLIDNKYIDMKVFKLKNFIYVEESEKCDIVQKIEGSKFSCLKDAFKVLMSDKYRNYYWRQCDNCGKAYLAISHLSKYCDDCKYIIKKEVINKSVKKTKNKKYILYEHISPNGKIYIGITSKNPEYRWANGEGYKQNKYFYRAIKKYGWFNFKHIILEEDLSYDAAYKKEKEYISKLKLTDSKYGYNISEGGKPSVEENASEYP